MTTTLLLAFTPVGAADADRPACLLPTSADGGGTILARLVATLRLHGPVTVLTWERWAPAVRSALAADTAGATDATDADADAEVAVVAVGTVDAALAHLAGAVEAAPDGVALIHAHLQADEVTLAPLVDAAASGSVVLVDPVARPAPAGIAPAGIAPAHVPGAPFVRATRGRVVAASSAGHRVAHPTHRAAGGLRLGPGATAPAAGHARAVAAAIVAGDLPRDADLLAWLLVATVRSGSVVGVNSPPRGGVARLVVDLPDAVEAGRWLDRIDPDAVRLAGAVKRDDGFFTTFLVSSYSPHLVRLAASLGIRPDTVTIASMVFGIAAAVAFATGTAGGMLAGALLLQAAFTLDCVDGQLARATRDFSTRGAWLDATFDRGKEYVVFAGLAVGGISAGETGPLWLLAGAALLLQTFRHTLDLGYAAQQTADVDRAVRRDLLDPGDGAPAFWEAVLSADSQATPATGPGPGPGPAQRIILALRRADDVPVLKWAKRIVVLPIGERFALISIVAVVAGPTAVFVALLAWGGLATAYTFTGRLVRSLA